MVVDEGDGMMEGWKAWVRFDGEGLDAKMVEGRAFMVSQLERFSEERRRRREAFFFCFF